MSREAVAQNTSSLDFLVTRVETPHNSNRNRRLNNFPCIQHFPLTRVTTE